MESKRKQKENEWLALLENAIKESIEIQVKSQI
jgi:hypothetical protein